MRIKRVWTIFVSRNLEYFRDKNALGWSFLFPFLVVVGFGIIFGDREKIEYKIGIYPAVSEKIAIETMPIPERFKKIRYAQFVGFSNPEEAFQKLKHHKIDFLIKIGSSPYQYWVSKDSPKGYMVENIFLASLMPLENESASHKQEIQGNQIRYVDWLFPGVLGMNMMFSSMFGVGYIIVYYRKNGVLKRLKATPLTAFEYLTAQMLSRMFVILFTVTVVWVGCDLIFSFHVQGSYLDLLIVAFIGGLSLIAISLIVASRGTSEEFTSGVLNFITWPMMFLSEVWFSLEGSPEWIKIVAKTFPLTYLISAARKIINDGATLPEVMPEITIMGLMTLIGLSIGAALFSWNK